LQYILLHSVHKKEARNQNGKLATIFEQNMHTSVPLSQLLHT
jgi:hypothetical protein